MKELKKCTKCGKMKPFSDFYKLKKGGYRADCKQCETFRRKDYRRRHQREENEHRRKYNATLAESKKNEKREWHREYYKKNSKEIIRKKILDHSVKMKNDEIYARKKFLQALIGRIVHRGQTPKEELLKEVEHVLGCDIKCFRKYFFDTWEKEYGYKWSGEVYEIDHIIPLHSAKTLEDVDILFHYTNLRCITPSDNRKKYFNQSMAKP